MNLNQIVYASEINKLGSFSKAAQKLYISQSALSKSIHALELELKQEIFIRTTEGVTATEFGKLFLAEGEKALHHITKIKGIAAAEENSEEGDVLKFSVACGQMFFAGEVFARILARYSHANTEFQFYQKSYSDVFTWVRDKVCNLGLIATFTTYTDEVCRLIAKNNMEYHAIGRLNVGVALGRNNPVYESGVNKLRKNMLKGQYLITSREHIWPFYREQEEIRAVFGNPKTIYVADNETAVNLSLQLSAYFCVAQSEKIYNKLNMPVSLLIYPYQNLNFKYEFAWIKRNGTELTAVEKMFINEITGLFH